MDTQTATQTRSEAITSRANERMETAIAEGFRPEWMVGICPFCSGPQASDSVYVGGVGYKTVRFCWLGAGANTSCKREEAGR